jgi:hypothetical protein
VEVADVHHRWINDVVLDDIGVGHSQLEHAHRLCTVSMYWLGVDSDVKPPKEHAIGSCENNAAGTLFSAITWWPFFVNQNWFGDLECFDFPH